MRHMQTGIVRIITSEPKQNIQLACNQQTSGCTMNKNYTPHDYKFAKALQEAIAQDVENKKALFTNPQDAEMAKKIIRRQV